MCFCLKNQTTYNIKKKFYHEEYIYINVLIFSICVFILSFFFLNSEDKNIKTVQINVHHYNIRGGSGP